ncbi:MAG: hypothetical protein ABSE43_09410, partial [Steroidobacteraceae bacterium]
MLMQPRAPAASLLLSFVALVSAGASFKTSAEAAASAATSSAQTEELPDRLALTDVPPADDALVLTVGSR